MRGFAAVARPVVRLWAVAAALCAVLFGMSGVCPGAAWAFGPVGSDPSANILPGDLPFDCYRAPTGSACEAAAVAALQHSRAVLGQPAYVLPSDFTTLSGDEQALILTNLDRALYGLPPAAGLTASFGADALVGVQNDADPSPSASGWTGWTANWAGGMPNMVSAYQMWMYDDGAGSGNIDCPYAGASGCWGHRHDILWDFSSVGPLVMGAAVGTDGRGLPGYAMLLVSERADALPSYTYSWAQALAFGAGGSAAAVSAPPSGVSTPAAAPGAAAGLVAAAPAVPSGGHVAGATMMPVRVARLTVAHRRVSVTVSGGRAGAPVRCSLSVLWRGRYVRDRFVRCTSTFSYVRVPRGRYRLRVRVGSVTVMRYLIVR